MSRVVCLGINVVDIIGRPISYIPEGGKLALIDSVEMHSGGCAVNTAIDLAKLGEEVGITSLVGEDAFGSFIEERLKNEKVDIEGLKVNSNTSTSVSIVLSREDGERSFLHSLGANALFNEEFIDMGIIEQCEVLFIGGALLMPSFDGEPAARVLKKAKELGKYTVLDTAWDPSGRWLSAVSPCLPYIDLFIPSVDEARKLSGKEEVKEMAQVFLEGGAKKVVIKLGEEGCYINNGQEEHRIKGFKVEAVDTTGAGDSFVAGFICGITNGWDLKRCGEFANAVGAHCVMKLGASTGIKSKDEILRFLKEKGL